MTAPVHVIGASGRSGAAVVRALLARGTRVVPVVRDAARWRATEIPPSPLLAEARIADLTAPDALRAALAGARRIASTAHARHTVSIAAAAPDRATLVLLGSTRRFSRWPDEHGRGVIAGETALRASGRAGVMLHPTMIYGATGEDNVQRLAALLQRLPVVPLPGGGRALVQPIHQDDVTRCVIAALDRDWPGPSALVIAGPEPVPYASFVRAVADAAGLPRRPVVAIPASVLMALAPLARAVPFLPRVRRDEIRRLLEDKSFETSDMRRELGISPRALAEGLRQTFPKGTGAIESGGRG